VHQPLRHHLQQQPGINDFPNHQIRRSLYLLELFIAQQRPVKATGNIPTNKRLFFSFLTGTSPPFGCSRYVKKPNLANRPYGASAIRCRSFTLTKLRGLTQQIAVVS